MQTLLYSLGRAFVRLYTRLMLRVDVCWRAPLPAGAKLVVANHPSAADPFYLALLSPRPLKLLITGNAFAMPLFGAYLRRSGHVCVAEGDGRGAFEQARRLLLAGESVALFPEGWISPQEGGFHLPHTGAARLALCCRVPVVPVGIYLPRGRNLTISSSLSGRRTVGYWYLRGPYAMTVGWPLYFEGDVDDRALVSSVTDRVMQRIVSLARQSERRVEPAG